VAYLGDSSPEALDRCPAMFEAMVVDHRDDVRGPFPPQGKDPRSTATCTSTTSSPAASGFANEVIIASHYSTRYTDDRIHRLLAKKIPDMLDGRLHVWL